MRTGEETFYLCKLLKNKGNLHYCTFFNGNLKVQKEEGSEKVLVGHILDLVKITGLARSDIEGLAYY